MDECIVVHCSQCGNAIPPKNDKAAEAFRQYPHLEYTCDECRRKQWAFDLGREIGYRVGFQAGRSSVVLAELSF